MKIALLLFVVLAADSVCTTAARAQTQSQMNQQAYQDFLVTDARLNQTYKQIMGTLDKQSQAKLRKSQRAWLAFRDAEADFQSDLTARGGSIAPLVSAETKTQMTKARTRELKERADVNEITAGPR